MVFATIQRNLDRVAAVLGLLVALALLPVQFFIQHIYAQTIPVILGAACVLYLVGARTDSAATPVALPRWAAHALPGGVLFGASGLVVLAHLQGARTRTFYALAALVSSLVLAQILFLRDRDRHAGVTLLQIVAIAVAVRFAAHETTAGFVGIDIWLHVPKFSRAILETGTIAGMTQTSWGATKYVMAPFYHLMVATTTLFAGVPPRFALLLSLGAIMPLTVLFVYVTADLLVPERWALLACALFAFSDSAIHWSLDLIPTSLGLVFFLAVLALVVRIVQLRTGAPESILMVAFFVGIALTHQVSSFILLVFLAAGWGTQLLIRAGLFDRPTGDARQLGAGNLGAVSFSGYFVFNLGLLTLIWSLTPYHGQSFLETVLLFIGDAIGGGGPDSGGITTGAGGATPPLTQFLVEHLHLVGFLMFMFGATVGGLYAFKQGRRNQAVLTFVSATVIMTAFTLLPPLIGVNTFLPGRWYPFLYAVMAILTAIGFGYLFRSLPPGALLAVMLLFAYMFPLVMVTSPNATLDSPVMKHEHTSLGYTQQDVTAVRTIGTITTSSPENPITTDFPYLTALNRMHSFRFGSATIPPGGQARGETVIYRDYQTTGAPQFGDGEGNQRVYRIREPVMCNPARTPVYDNGKVRVCQAG